MLCTIVEETVKFLTRIHLGTHRLVKALLNSFSVERTVYIIIRRWT